MSSFVNPALLGGLILLTAPIIIHLLNKRHFQVIDWAAMDFLLQADSKNRRRIRLEDLILLLLRMLVIALIVLAVARPLIRGAGGRGEEERVVVLDDSFSMDASDGASTAFSLARAAAVSQVEDAVGRSIPVSLWFGTRPEAGGRDVRAVAPGGPGDPAPGSPTDPAPGSPGDPAPPSPADEAAGLLDALRGAQAGDVALRFAALLERLAERFEARKEAGVRSVVLVSDFRAADWLEPGAGGGAVGRGEGPRGGLRSELAAAFADLARRGLTERLRWKLIDVGSASRENAAVTGIRLATAHPLAKVPARILVDARNFGASDRRFVTGELEVSEAVAPAAKPAVDASSSVPAEKKEPAPRFQVLHRIPLPALDVIPAGKTATFEVELTFERPGTYLLRATIEGDRLARDDASYAVARVRDGIRALVADGDPGQGRFSGESGFLLSALAPRGASSGILPRRVVGQIPRQDVLESDVVFILNRDRVSEEERQALEALAARGGGIAFFLGNRVAAASYAETGSLFPARLGAVQEAAGRARLRIADPAHPAFEAFRGIEGSSLETVGFDRFLGIEPEDGARVAARYTDPAGTPAIIDAPAGKGRAAIFNLSADRDWNDWPADPSYPIVLQEWARYLARRGEEERTVIAGDLLSWEPAAGVRYAVVTPDGESHPVNAGSGTAASFAGTRLAGFHCVVPEAVAEATALSRGALEPSWYAVRRDPAESDLEPAGEERLRAALSSAGVEFVLGREVDVDVFARGEEGETWRLLACGGGIFLLVELLAAWWFGRRG
jgi:hypothetical protein